MIDHEDAEPIDDGAGNTYYRIKNRRESDEQQLATASRPGAPLVHQQD